MKNHRRRRGLCCTDEDKEMSTTRGKTKGLGRESSSFEWEDILEVDTEKGTPKCRSGFVPSGDK